MAYTTQSWTDYPSTSTPITAARLGHIEDGIYAAAQTADNAATSAASALSALSATVRAEDYGAAGDGVTDDAAAISAAITAAAPYGLRVQLLPRMYAVGSQITATVPVEGGGATLTAIGTARTKLLVASAAVKDLTVDATSVTITSYMVEIPTGSAAVRLERVTFLCTGAAEGQRVQGVETRDNVTDLTISGCRFIGQTTAIRLNRTPSGVLIDGCTFAAWEDAAVYVLGTATTRAVDVTIRGCRIGPHRTRVLTGSPDPLQVCQPIRVLGDDSNRHRNIAVVNNHITASGTGHADPTNPGSADCISVHRTDGVLVHGNTVSGSGDVGVTVSQQCINVTISGNVIRDSDSVGICVGSSDSTDTRNVTITGNVVTGSNQNRQNDNVARAKAGVLLNKVIGGIVSGNALGDLDGSATQVNAISLANVTDVTIGDNSSSGITGAYLYSEGTNTGVRWNVAPSRVVKTADTVRNNTLTVSNDPHLVGLPLSPGGVYRLTSRLKWNATTTADLGLKWSAPSGTAIDWTTGGPIPTAASANTSTQYTPQTVGSTATLGGVGGVCNGFPEGVITVGSTAGTLALQWAQGTAAEATDCTLYAGSWVQIERIG